MSLTGSRPFVASDDFLWFCLTCRQSGIPASTRLQIADGMTALDMDNAVSLRLLKFDREVMEQNARLIAYEVGKLLGGEGDGEGIDETTEIW